MQKAHLQVPSLDNSQSCYELLKLPEERKAAVAKELCKGQIYSAAGTVPTVANMFINPLLKGLIDTVLGKMRVDRTY